MRTEVAGRIAMMETTPPEVIKRVEQVLEKKVSSILGQEATQAGGPKALVDLLNRVDRSTERLIIESLNDTAPELADVVRNMMFVFEDVVGAGGQGDPGPAEGRGREGAGDGRSRASTRTSRKRSTGT